MKVLRVTMIGLLATAWLAIFRPAGASQTMVEVDWGQTPPASGRVVDGSVEVTAGSSGGTYPLVTIDGPDVGSRPYVVTGQVRYEGVAGVGFIEMWSVFPDGGRFFTRTLDDTGPLAALTGTSDWRAFELPFFPGDGPGPTELEINLVLPADGRVWVGPLRLESLEDRGGLGADGSGWWSSRAAGVAGAIGGAAVGILSTLTAWLVSRGRARAFVLATAVALIVIGAASLAAGAVALLGHQPYEVVFPLLLSGAILVTVFWGLAVRARRAYAQAELRRMRAFDAR